MLEQLTTCRWTVRPGTSSTFWAHTPCKPGFNYLSKVNNAGQIESAYGGRLCPICGKKIELNLELLQDVIYIGGDDESDN